MASLGFWRGPIGFTRLLTSVFGLVFAVGLCTILYLGVAAAERNTQQLLTDHVQSTMAAVVGQIDTHMKPVETQLLYLRDFLTVGSVAVEDKYSMNLLLSGALASTPQVLGLSFFYAEGRDVMHVSRNSQQPAIEQARYGGQISRLLKEPPADMIRLPPVWNRRLGSAVIPQLVPIYQQAEFKGLLVVVVNLKAVSAFFSHLSDQLGFQIFALYGADRVLAYSHLDDSATKPQGNGNPLPLLEDMQHPAMAQLWNPKRKSIGWLSLDGIQGHRLRIEDTDYVYFYQQKQVPHGKPFTIGIFLEQEEAPLWVKRLVLVTVASVLIILLLLFVVGWISRRIGGRMERLVVGFDAMRHQALDSIQPLPGSRVTEFNKVAQAYNRMLADMREHQTVEKLFGQYVPEKIAKELVQHAGALEPQQATATVLFCDLEAFTALSERLMPAQIFKVLNSYFSDVVGIIEAEGGIITQFQGDAVLAIFNVPTAQADHAERAYRAAMGIQQLVSAKIYDGQRLRCRIGVNTGDVIAGSVGAKDRLNYTVHGDAVNLAARLEVLNKSYRTGVLLSESTVALLSDADLRQQLVSIGKVKIRGRQRTVALYTPRLGESRQASAE